MSIRKVLAQNIKTLRRKKGLSQEELSFRVGLHRTYVSSLERGVSNPTLDVLVKLARTLGVKLRDLIE